MRARVAPLLRLVLSSIGISLLTLGASAEDLHVPPRVLEPVDESQLTTLQGNTHPLARPQFDRGVAPPDLPMQRMLLLLKRSPEQQSALITLMDDQQDKASPNYHKWLTPEQFGKQFGPADQDIQTITSWLQSHGFEIGRVSKGRTMIEFSGTAAQLREAFHTSIHKYVVNGQQHWANAADPQIPAALTPVVAGVHTLHNFLKKPMIRFTGEKVAGRKVPGKSPELTFSDGTHGLGPADFATIYNLTPLYKANPAVNGSGTTIAVVGRTHSQSLYDDIAEFGSVFNVNNRFAITVNGPDPGDLGTAEDAEAALDASWSGAVAQGTFVNFVTSASTNTTDGVDLSELYIVDNNLGDVMTESFSGCEGEVTVTEAQGISMLAEQAAAQGITYAVATGDSGAEGCDDPNSESIATGPLSVNVLAATPFAVAVGGTQFNENGHDGKYWNSTSNATDEESALSYIPEDVWNQSCTTAQCGKNANIGASGGGASIFFAKPSWQANVPGIPKEGWRDIPDVSFTAAAHDPYLICLNSSCLPGSPQGIQLYLVSGTSASTPSFAGIMALVDQKMGQITNQSVERQGQANYVLYPLAAKESSEFGLCNASNTSALPASTCVFNDVTSGNNEVPGEQGYPSAPYSSGVGYDQATGLGSTNVTNLVNGWASTAFNATTATLSLNPVSITHGQSVNVDITVAANGGKGTPTGAASLLMSGTTSVGVPLQSFGLSGGMLQTSTYALPGGSYSVTGHYAGDGTFAPSTSSPVSVAVSPEASQTKLAVCTYPTPQSSCPPISSGPYGSFVFLSAAVSSNSQTCPPDCGLPTGSIQFYDNNFGSVGNPNLNNQGNAWSDEFYLGIGSHSIVASYSGDSSYDQSQSAPTNFAVTPAATSTVVTWTGDLQGADLIASVNSSSAGNWPTGNVTFFINGAAVGNSQPVYAFSSPIINPITEQVTTGAQAATLSWNDTQFVNGQTYNVTASYSGDIEYYSSSSPVVKITLQPDFALSANPNSLSVSSPGGSGTLSVSLGVLDGFNGTVSFNSSACTGLPAGANCSFSTSSLTGRGATTTLTVTTTASNTGMLKRDILYPNVVFASGLFLFGIVSLALPKTRRRSNALHRWLLCTVLVAFTGCGGGNVGQSGTNPPAPASPTPAGSYPVTVTATSGNLSHEVTFSLNVQ